MNKNKLKKFIVNNEIEQFFSLISEYKFESKRTEKSLLLLKSRFSKIENDNINGILSQSTYSIQRNQIINGLIEIIDSNVINTKTPTFKENNKDTLLANQTIIINQNNRIIEKQDELKENSEKIFEKISEQYTYLISNIKSNISETEIQTIIENIQRNENNMINIGLDIMNHINWAFEEYGKDLDDRLHEIHTDLKKSDSWRTKLELSVPFLNLLGINLKHEVYLNKYIKWIKEKFA